jgi:SAM-dependent methyltransferase
MLPSGPDFSKRAYLRERMDEPCSRDDLRGCLKDIARINRWTRAPRPILLWLNEHVDSGAGLPQPLRILDVGSGFGDGLRRIERWAIAKGVGVELTGLDLNPDAASIAAEATSAASRIQWITSNVFHFAPSRPFHLVVSSLFTHHLIEADIIRFLRWMENHAEIGWFVNDLSRASTPYHFIRIVSKLARLHPFVQHDAPVSIARAFVPEDWRAMCAAAGLAESNVVIQAFKPARLCVSRRKPPATSVLK